MILRPEASDRPAVTAPAHDLVVRSITRPAAVTNHYRPGPGSYFALATLLATSAALGQENPQKNRFGVSYRAGWNIKGTFSGIGGLAPQSNPGSTGGNVDHEYDDGYVLVDSTNSGLDLTWNWGFDNASQVNGDNLEMRSSRALSDGRRESDDFQHGFEATYARELGTFRKARWGVEGAFNYLHVGISDSGSVPITLVTTVDTYDLEGVDPFDPPGSQIPNQGTFTGPGPLIPDAPASRREEVTSRGAQAAGKRELDANLFGIRIGPYIDLPLSANWLVTLNAGFALVSVNSDFKFSETVTAPGLNPVSRRGSNSESDLLPGGYVGANISFQVARSIRLFAGAEYQHVGEFTQQAGEKRAELDLGQSVFVKAGVSFSF